MGGRSRGDTPFSVAVLCQGAAQRRIGAARWVNTARQSGTDRRPDPQAQTDQTPGLWPSRVPIAPPTSPAGKLDGGALFSLALVPQGKLAPSGGRLPPILPHRHTPCKVSHLLKRPCFRHAGIRRDTLWKDQLCYPTTSMNCPPRQGRSHHNSLLGAQSTHTHASRPAPPWCRADSKEAGVGS